MILSIIIITLVFVAIVFIGRSLKHSLEKIFDEVETEEPLDESDIMALFHESKNN